jgi:hypothetical protein
VFDNRVQRRIIGLKREKGCRKLHNEELHNLYLSKNIRVIKSRVGWAGQITRMKEIVYIKFAIVQS